MILKIFPTSHDANKIDTYAERSVVVICVEYLHPYCKPNILSYYSVNINISIGIGQMCFDISVLAIYHIGGSLLIIDVLYNFQNNTQVMLNLTIYHVMPYVMITH